MSLSLLFLFSIYLVGSMAQELCALDACGLLQGHDECLEAQDEFEADGYHGVLGAPASRHLTYVVYPEILINLVFPLNFPFRTGKRPAAFPYHTISGICKEVHDTANFLPEATSCSDNVDLWGTSQFSRGLPECCSHNRGLGTQQRSRHKIAGKGQLDAQVNRSAANGTLDPFVTEEDECTAEIETRAVVPANEGPLDLLKADPAYPEISFYGTYNELSTRDLLQPVCMILYGALVE